MRVNIAGSFYIPVGKHSCPLKKRFGCRNNFSTSAKIVFIVLKMTNTKLPYIHIVSGKYQKQDTLSDVL